MSPISLIKILQNDITGILDSSGAVVVTYEYDTWGKMLAIEDGAGNDVSGNSSHVANLNPFRYRGYYYDNESGLYYLNSRYYDPEVGRFINADGLTSTGQGVLGNNMFTYCGNNPVNRADPSGQFWGIVAVAVAVVVEVVVKAVVTTSIINKAINQAVNNNEYDAALAKKDVVGAYHAYESKKIADKYTDSIYGAGAHVQDHNQVNAFRHTMWNAAMTRKMGAAKAYMFATVHEKRDMVLLNTKTGDERKALSQQISMDLHNNNLGRRIALQNPYASYDELAVIIKNAIDSGQAVVTRWD